MLSIRPILSPPTQESRTRCVQLSDNVDLTMLAAITSNHTPKQAKSLTSASNSHPRRPSQVHFPIFIRCEYVSTSLSVIRV